MRYHFIPVTMLSSINEQTTVLVRMWRKGSPSALLVGMQIGTATVANTRKFPQKIKNVSASDPMILLLGIYTNSE